MILNSLRYRCIEPKTQFVQYQRNPAVLLMCRIAGFVFWGMGGVAEHIVWGGDLCF